ncbi:hypothetical protein [Hymenobacter cellulosilyticus]|uniref:Uncharacterized protein n=1 Tax=Hymenobacter cellulosilyticus TaxID=2932248 RepID=A0A8T9QA15_9BACT|nr:hypothetical protein [Hymenobacter cellulosilyticus]UOQ74367.1 hypothetical protein MUN79_11080 [Hymenobacter cellulosilyticus]
MLAALSLTFAAASLWTQAFATSLPVGSPSVPTYWQVVAPAQAKRLGKPRIQMQHYQVWRLNLEAVRRILSTATAGPAGPELQLPLPDGTVARFRMRTSSVMAPALAAKYPELQTYAGRK